MEACVKVHYRRGVRGVVPNLGLVEPQGLSRSVSGARWLGSPHSYDSYEIHDLLDLFFEQSGLMSK